MPIYKRCSRCNKRIQSGSKCGCSKSRHKEYKRYRKDDKEQQLYSSNIWSIIRGKVKERFNGLDIYSYYILGKIEIGYTVHHIETIKDNWDKRLELDNLIYLTESNHQLIHNMMDKDKQGTMDMLYGLIKRYLEEFE